jgi:hypothetical protein
VVARGFTRRRFLQLGALGVTSGALLGGLPVGLGRGSSASGAALPGAPGLGYPGMPNAAVLGAELQYFRMSPDAIGARLALCQQAHYGVIQTYVPWNVHEFFQGSFDFVGRTTPILPDDHFDEYQIEDPLSEYEAGGLVGRAGLTANSNLLAFLEQVAALGFKMVLRPGPFISDEWRNGGIPDWLLLEGDPEMFARGPDGSALGPGFPFSPPLSTVLGGSTLYYFSSPSYASTQYLDAAATWLSAFTTFLRSGNWLASQGGPVVAVQVDDESCFFYRFGAFEVDYHPAMLQRWASYSGGQPAPRAWPAPEAGIASLQPAIQWQRFKAAQVATYLGALAADLRAAGCDVPINHELEQHMCPPTEMADVAQVVILNGEYYDSGDPWNLPVNELNAQSVRAASRQRQPTYATEMNNGDPLLYNILLGEGILGGLQFTYTEGVADGALDVLSVVGRTFEAAGPMLGQAIRRADLAIVWDSQLTWAPFGSDRWGFSRDVRRVIERHVPALATLLVRAGYAFDLLDVHVAQPEDLARYPVIFLAAADIVPSDFQGLLVDYVEAGGRLVCWPAPPTLDENLAPCTTLADALYPEAVVGHDATDGAQVQVTDVTVPTWLGVDFYEPSSPSQAIATLGGRTCGYQRPCGSGMALLLGTWLAADSVPGREGTIIESESAPSGFSPVLALTQMAAQTLGTEAAGLVPDTLPGDTPQDLLVYAYTNERRGGETISSGAVAYWDGENAIGLVEIGTDVNEPALSTMPYHPILDGHIWAARMLAAIEPQVSVTDSHLQARILDGPVPGSATLVVANRWPDDLSVTLGATVSGIPLQLPRTGTFVLPSSSGLILPIGYPLAGGRTLEQATGQLLGVASTPDQLQLTFLVPANAEVVVTLEGLPNTLMIEGRPANYEIVAQSPGSATIAFTLPTGEPTAVITLG